MPTATTGRRAYPCSGSSLRGARRVGRAAGAGTRAVCHVLRAPARRPLCGQVIGIQRRRAVVELLPGGRQRRPWGRWHVYVGAPRRINDSKYVELDPKVLQELARARVQACNSY